MEGFRITPGENEAIRLLAGKGRKAPIFIQDDDERIEEEEEESSWMVEQNEDNKVVPGLVPKPSVKRKADNSNLNARMNDAIIRAFFMEKEADSMPEVYQQAVAERDALVRERELLEIRTSFRNGAYSVARALTKRGLNQKEVMEWLSEPFTNIFNQPDLEKIIERSQRWVDKRRKI